MEYARGKAKVVAINNSYQIAPWADVLYAADKEWWREYQPEFAGLRYAVREVLPNNAPWPKDVTLLRHGSDTGLEADPSRLSLGGMSGAHSGYQAINLAVHLGASRILLLGYDLQRGEAGQTHWHGNHRGDLKSVSPWVEFLKAYPTLVKPLAKRGIELVNCSRRSALTCFPQMSIDRALTVAVAA